MHLGIVIMYFGRDSAIIRKHSCMIQLNHRKRLLQAKPIVQRGRIKIAHRVQNAHVMPRGMLPYVPTKTSLVVIKSLDTDITW